MCIYMYVLYLYAYERIRVRAVGRKAGVSRLVVGRERIIAGAERRRQLRSMLFLGFWEVVPCARVAPLTGPYFIRLFLLHGLSLGFRAHITVRRKETESTARAGSLSCQSISALPARKNPYSPLRASLTALSL